uniref:Uncharacterized protein n=1 Tax=Solanum lycopersicum TaxID=4081 RepID=A0A3Q7H232_SOLLC
MTPPPAIVPLIRVSSSSSPRMASCKCLGVILFTLRSLLALPANSRTSAVSRVNSCCCSNPAMGRGSGLELTLIDQKMMSPLKIFDESKKFKVPKE